jgi:hypothetical protein
MIVSVTWLPILPLNALMVSVMDAFAVRSDSQLQAI